jgi:hypothetical protein
MTPEEADKRIEELRASNIKCHKFDFRDQKPIPYLKIEVFEIEITQDSFHWAKGREKQGGDWVDVWKIADWKKNYIFTIGGMCGVESLPFQREREGKYSYISKARVSRLLPSGGREGQSAAYEYDAQVRAEEAIVENLVKHERAKANKWKQVDIKYKTEAEKQLLVIQNAKFAPQKADSGAQKRAIIKMLKFPTPSKELIGVHLFCYKCSPNFDSPDVRNQYLLNDPTRDVFGGGQQQLSHGAVDADFSVEPSEPEPTKEAPGEPAASDSPAGEPDELWALVHGTGVRALEKVATVVITLGDDLPELLSFLRGYKAMSSYDRTKAVYEWIMVCDRKVKPTDDPNEMQRVIAYWGGNNS